MRVSTVGKKTAAGMKDKYLAHDIRRTRNQKTGNPLTGY
jgi:hypothetical protein